jgi:hypothetical protein
MSKRYVLFKKGHHAMAKSTLALVGQIGTVRMKETFPGGEEWLIDFPFTGLTSPCGRPQIKASRWLKPRYLVELHSPEEAADLAAEAERQYY